jgi:hypothetical protein
MIVWNYRRTDRTLLYMTCCKFTIKYRVSLKSIEIIMLWYNVMKVNNISTIKCTGNFKIQHEKS